MFSCKDPILLFEWRYQALRISNTRISIPSGLYAIVPVQKSPGRFAADDAGAGSTTGRLVRTLEPSYRAGAVGNNDVAADERNYIGWLIDISVLIVFFRFTLNLYSLTRMVPVWLLLI